MRRVSTPMHPRRRRRRRRLLASGRAWVAATWKRCWHRRTRKSTSCGCSWQVRGAGTRSIPRARRGAGEAREVWAEDHRAARAGRVVGSVASRKWHRRRRRVGQRQQGRVQVGARRGRGRRRSRLTQRRWSPAGARRLCRALRKRRACPPTRKTPGPLCMRQRRGRRRAEAAVALLAKSLPGRPSRVSPSTTGSHSCGRSGNSRPRSRSPRVRRRPNRSASRE